MDNNYKINELADTHLSCAVAFVEGGIQEACEDACSICLDPFSHNNPSTVTTCKHEYHLQCILEWSQRSRQCPMCWQLLSLSDLTSQDLLEAVEKEKMSRIRQHQNLPHFHPTSFEDFNLHNIPINTDDLDFEERIMQHLAGVAAMSRAREFTRRETLHDRSNAQGHPQFVLSSSNPNVSPLPPTSPISNYTASHGGNSPTLTALSPTTPLAAAASQSTQVESESHSARIATRPPVLHRNVAGHPSMKSQGRAGPSEIHSFSESFKYRFSAMSSRHFGRCKESISKTTRGFRERLWARNASVTDLGREVQRDVTIGIADVARIMEHIDLDGKNRGGIPSVSEDTERSSGIGPDRRSIDENHGKTCSSNNIGVNLCTSSSSSNSSSSRVAPQPPNDKPSHSMDTSSLKDVEDNCGGGNGCAARPSCLFILTIEVISDC
ncbi:hypothetical protein KI387_017256, partial [Taxus chinensis]